MNVPPLATRDRRGRSDLQAPASEFASGPHHQRRGSTVTDVSAEDDDEYDDAARYPPHAVVVPPCVPCGAGGDAQFEVLSPAFPDTVVVKGVKWPSLQRYLLAAGLRNEEDKVRVHAAGSHTQAARIAEDADAAQGCEDTADTLALDGVRARAAHPAFCTTLRETKRRPIFTPKFPPSLARAMAQVRLEVDLPDYVPKELFNSTQLYASNDFTTETFVTKLTHRLLERQKTPSVLSFAPLAKAPVRQQHGSPRTDTAESAADTHLETSACFETLFASAQQLLALRQGRCEERLRVKHAALEEKRRLFMLNLNAQIPASACAVLDEVDEDVHALEGDLTDIANKTTATAKRLSTMVKQAGRVRECCELIEHYDLFDTMPAADMKKYITLLDRLRQQQRDAYSTQRKTEFARRLQHLQKKLHDTAASSRRGSLEGLSLSLDDEDDDLDICDEDPPELESLKEEIHVFPLPTIFALGVFSSSIEGYSSEAKCVDAVGRLKVFILDWPAARPGVQNIYDYEAFLSNLLLFDLLSHGKDLIQLFGALHDVSAAALLHVLDKLAPDAVPVPAVSSPNAAAQRLTDVPLEGSMAETQGTAEAVAASRHVEELLKGLTEDKAAPKQLATSPRGTAVVAEVKGAATALPPLDEECQHVVEGLAARVQMTYLAQMKCVIELMTELGKGYTAAENFVSGVFLSLDEELATVPAIAPPLSMSGNAFGTKPAQVPERLVTLLELLLQTMTRQSPVVRGIFGSPHGVLKRIIDKFMQDYLERAVENAMSDALMSVSNARRIQELFHTFPNSKAFEEKLENVGAERRAAQQHGVPISPRSEKFHQYAADMPTDPHAANEVIHKDLSAFCKRLYACHRETVRVCQLLSQTAPEVAESMTRHVLTIFSQCVKTYVLTEPMSLDAFLCYPSGMSAVDTQHRHDDASDGTSYESYAARTSSSHTETQNSGGVSLTVYVRMGTKAAEEAIERIKYVIFNHILSFSVKRTGVFVAQNSSAEGGPPAGERLCTSSFATVRASHKVSFFPKGWHRMCVSRRCLHQ